LKSFKELAGLLSNSVSDVRNQHHHATSKDHKVKSNQNNDRTKTIQLACEITNITKSGAAFAKEINGARSIFVPFPIVERSGIYRGDLVLATTVPNKLYESWSPGLGVMQPAELFAVHVEALDFTQSHQEQEDQYEEREPEAKEQVVDVPKPSIQDRIMLALSDGPYRASALAKKIGGEPTYVVFDTLRDLHRDGKVARASIYTKDGQKQASCVVWGLTMHDLLPELDDDDIE
jgi:DNA-binding HxlR family transcriptional regulator